MNKTAVTAATVLTAALMGAAVAPAHANKASIDWSKSPPVINVGTLDEVPIWSLQLRFATGSNGSGDDVFVFLDPTAGGVAMHDNWFHLDLAKAERATYTTDTYEIPLQNGIKNVSDLAGLVVAKSGNNGWPINSVEVLVNGAPLYQAPWTLGLPGYASRLLHWLTNWDAYTLGYWDTYTSRAGRPLPGMLDVPELVPMDYFRDLIETTVGHYVRTWTLNRSDWSYTWKHAPTVTQINDSTIRVSLGVAQHHHGWGATGTSFQENVDTYVQMSCQDGDIVPTVFGDLWRRPRAQIEKALYDAFLHLPCPISMQFTRAGLAMSWQSVAILAPSRCNPMTSWLCWSGGW